MPRTKAYAAVAVVIALIAGVIWLRRPVRVINHAIAELAAAPTATFQAELAVENEQLTKQLLKEPGVIIVKLDGAYDRAAHPRDNLVAAWLFTIKTESVTVEAEGEARFVGDAAYLHIEKAAPVFTGLNQLKGQWFTLPRGAMSPPAADHDTGEPLFTSVRRAGRAEVDGRATVRYRAEATGAAVVRLMDTVASLLGTTLSEVQIENIRANAQASASIPVELWISPWTGRLVRWQATISPPKGNRVTFTLRVKDLSISTDITAPPHAVPLPTSPAPEQPP